MPEQMRPASEKQAPDPAHSYERSDPKRESGQGKLDANTKATPTPCEDAISSAATNAHAADRQLNSEESATVAPKDKNKSNEPLGWEKPKA